MTPPVQILSTGVANLEAVAAAFRRLGRTTRLVEDADDIARADHLVLPGVGSFAAGMEALRENGWVDPLRQRVAEGLPTLAICLGLQLLCEGSDEAPGVAGLGCVSGQVRRFGEGVRSPQLGWNRLEAPNRTHFLRSGFVYYANSYCLVDPPDGWSYATSRHGGRFVAGLERDGVVACQFHPELSGRTGRALLRRWLAVADQVASVTLSATAEPAC